MSELIDKYLVTDFEKNLYNASLAYLENEKDPLRINSFAYSLRELIRNVFSRIAPDEHIRHCSWFLPETENGAPSRKQRFYYSAKGGLSVDFVSNTLGIDLNEPWQEIKSAIDTLSKYTHVNENTFDVAKEECIRISTESIGAFNSILYTIDEIKTELHQALYMNIDNELLNTFVTNSISDIDILSHMSYVEGSEITDYEITDITYSKINFAGEGNAYVSLNYGKGDDACEINDEFPFTFTGVSSIHEPLSVSISPEDISIDIDSWYE